MKPGSRPPSDYAALSIPQLAERCATAMSRFRQRRAYDPAACYELFRRALAQQDQKAWQALYAQYHRLVLHWLDDAPGDADELVNQVFGRFWQALVPDRFAAFPSLDALLEYLRRCAQTVAFRAVRQAEQQRLREAAARLWHQDRQAAASSSWSEQVLGRIAGQDLYAQIMDRLADPAERLVFRASFEWNMQPRAIAARWPHLFADGRQVSRVKERTLRRLRRDREIKDLLRIVAADGGNS